MSTPGSMVESANITVDNSDDEVSDIDGGKQTKQDDGDEHNAAEPVLPEKLNFLLQQSSIYSKIIAEKLARDTAERQKKDARASTKRANKAKREQDRHNEAGRETRSGRATGADDKARNGTCDDVLSSPSDSGSDGEKQVMKQDFVQKRKLQSSNGRQARNARSRQKAVEAPAKQVASSLGLKTKNNDTPATRQSPRSTGGRATKSHGTKSQAIEIEDSDDNGDGPLDAKKEDEEGEDSASDGDNESDGEAKSRQPRLVSGATMKSYQLAGMEWLISLYENGLNGILADEMGLGKTLQTISFLAYLRDKGVWGPFLVVCPLSTLANWVNEFERFTPDIPAILYHGTPKEREEMREERMSIPVDIVKGKRNNVKATKRGTYHFTTTETFPVVVTSYELVMQDRKHLSKYDWKYLIIDESHRIKNLNCKLIRELMSYKSANRLLLTGTPLQNNLEELWSLLNFLMPEIFDDLDSFKSWFDIDVTSDDTASVQIVTKLHSILKPFLLRRVKREVEKGLPPKKEYLLSAGLTPEQKKLYDAVVKRQIRDFLIRRKDLLPDDDKAPFSSDDEAIPAKASKKSKSKQGKNGVKRKLGQEDSNDGADEQEEDQPKVKRARPSYVEKTEQEFLQALSDGEEREKAEDFEKQRYAHIYSNGETEADAGKTQTKKVNQLKLQNMVMQLRKVCNHPWLFEWPMDPKTGEYVIDKRIVDTSGKMMLLDRLLTELFRTGHKCLVFSQFTSQIDIIQDWAEEHKRWKTMRIDGLTKQDDRRSQLKAFNEETGRNSTHLFLLSTRSGGVGINLTGADTVILYDSDWNPQMDLQAMDRAHRLGQTKPVLIFRLVTANTIESKMLERAGAKRKLEALVIGSGKYTTSLEDLQDIFTGNTSRAGKDASGAGLAAQMFAAEMKEVEQGKEIKIVRNAKEAISDAMLKTLLDRSDEAMSRDRGWRVEDAAKAIEVIETAAADGENGDELADFFHNEESAPASPGSDEME